MSSDDVIPLLTSALSEIMHSGKKSCERTGRKEKVDVREQETLGFGQDLSPANQDSALDHSYLKKTTTHTSLFT